MRHHTYPTGLRVQYVDEQSADGRVRVRIEETLFQPTHPVFSSMFKLGDVEVSGSIRTGNGALAIETLPVWTFRGHNRWHRAMLLAAKLCGHKVESAGALC